MAWRHATKCEGDASDCLDEDRLRLYLTRSYRDGYQHWEAREDQLGPFNPWWRSNWSDLEGCLAYQVAVQVERLLRKMVLKLSNAIFPITLNPTFQQLGPTSAAADGK